MVCRARPVGTMTPVSAAEFVPESRSLARLAAAAEGCRGCELYENATQTVFGAGPRRARLLLVGEQPGDVEDRAGEPFVGPAGKVLDRALAAADIARADTFLTNAVKHFRWKSTASSKRRLHQTPTAGQVTACRPWLGAELAAVRPQVVVALGATATLALLGRGVRLSDHRGEPLPWPPPDGEFRASRLGIEAVYTTIHPSAVLRADNRKELMTGLVADLRAAAATAGAAG